MHEKLFLNNFLNYSWPHARIKDFSHVIVHPVLAPLSGFLWMPGSKSVTNRALLLASLAKGTSVLYHYLHADDTYWCCKALDLLGVALNISDTEICLQGVCGQWPKKKEEIYIGDAGTLARFFPGLLGASSCGSWVIKASAQLCARPMKPMLESLRDLGIKVEQISQNYPIRIHGGTFMGGKTSISGAISSQFISGLLLAAPLAKNFVSIDVQDHLIHKDYVKMTIRMMADFGVDVIVEDDYRRYFITPQTYKARHYSIEADASTASYFFALAAVTRSCITVKNISKNTLQPDIQFLEILKLMGCSVVETKEGITVEGPQQLRGNKIFDMGDIADTVPTLAAIAIFSDGPIRIRGVAHIQNHETNRLDSLYSILCQLGIRVEKLLDGLTIYPGKLSFASVSSYNDHRIAMAMAIVGLAGDGICIENPGCVAKTCPNFFALLETLKVKVEYDNCAFAL